MLCLQVLQYTEPHVLDGKNCKFFLCVYNVKRKLTSYMKGCLDKMLIVIARFSFQIIVHLPLEQKENLTLHQKVTLKALSGTLLQMQTCLELRAAQEGMGTYILKKVIILLLQEQQLLQ